MISGCAGFPIPPKTSLCTFDNRSKDDNSHKSPNFKCKTQAKKRVIIRWNSDSADGMMCTPYADYLKQQAYIEKVFYIIKQEMTKR